METQSLWPDFTAELMKSPATILREQAGYLAEKTKNVLQAEVRISENKKDEFIFSFIIIAPALKNYRYSLLQISYGIACYPVIIYHTTESGITVPHYQLKDEEEFVNYVRKVLNDPHTINIIASLYSESIANG
jgi:hypothetical protein